MKIEEKLGSRVNKTETAKFGHFKCSETTATTLASILESLITLIKSDGSMGKG